MAFNTDPNVQQWLDYFNQEMNKKYYVTNPNYAKDYYAQQKAQAAQQTVKQDTSNHHSLGDVMGFLRNNMNSGTTQDYNYMQKVGQNQQLSGNDKVRSDLGHSLMAGVGDIIKGIGDTMRWASSHGPANELQDVAKKKGIISDTTGPLEQAGQSLSNWADKNIVQPNNVQYGKPFSAQSLRDPDWYATSVARSVPFTIASIPLGLGGAKLGSTALGSAAKALGAKETVQNIARLAGGGVGATALNAPFEAAQEAAQTYDQALKEGHDKHTASSMADKVWWNNLALLGATETPEFAMMFAPFIKRVPVAGQVADSVGKSIAKGAAKVAGSAALEGGQEMAQQYFQDSAQGHSLDWNAMYESGVIGALMGGVTTAGTHLAEGLQHRQQHSSSNQSQPTNPTQPQSPTDDILQHMQQTFGENGDINDTIHNNVRQQMSSELKNEVSNVQDQLEASGKYTPEEVQSHVNDYIASTDEGKQLYSDEILRQQNRVNGQSTQPNQKETSTDQQTEQPAPEVNPVTESPPEPAPSTTPEDLQAKMEELKQGVQQATEQSNAVANQADLLQQQVMGQQPQAQQTEVQQPEQQSTQETSGPQPKVDANQSIPQDQVDQLAQDEHTETPQTFTKGDRVRQTSNGLEGVYDGEPLKHNQNLHKVTLDNGKVQYWSPKKMKKVEGSQTKQSAEQPKAEEPKGGVVQQEIQKVMLYERTKANKTPEEKLAALNDIFDFRKKNNFKDEPLLTEEYNKVKAEVEKPKVDHEAKKQEKTSEEPKAKWQVGDTIRNKETGKEFTVHSVNQHGGTTVMDNGKEVYANAKNYEKVEKTGEKSKEDSWKTPKDTLVKQLEEAWNEPKRRGVFETMWPYNPEYVKTTLRIAGIEFPYDMTYEEYNHKWVKEKGGPDELGKPLQAAVLKKFDEIHGKSVGEKPTPKPEPKKEPAPKAEPKADKPKVEQPKQEKKRFKEGDRVQFSLNGETLTGTIRSVYANTANVNVDQISHVGGVPIGRIEVVPFSHLKPIEESKQESKAPTENTSNQQEPTNAKADQPKDKYEKAHESLSWLDDLADRADAYIKKNKGRSNALPVDLYGAVAIVGARKIAHGVIDFAQWSEEMMKEYGQNLRLSLRSLYTLSEDITKFSPADLEEFLTEYHLDELKTEQQPEEQQSQADQPKEPTAEEKLTFKDMYEKSLTSQSSAKNKLKLWTQAKEYAEAHNIPLEEKYQRYEQRLNDAIARDQQAKEAKKENPEPKQPSKKKQEDQIQKIKDDITAEIQRQKSISTLAEATAEFKRRVKSDSELEKQINHYLQENKMHENVIGFKQLSIKDIYEKVTPRLGYISMDVYELLAANNQEEADIYVDMMKNSSIMKEAFSDVYNRIMKAGEKNVSNPDNSGSVPKGETTGELPGTKENGQTETVSSPDGGKSQNGDRQSDNGQSDQRSSGNGLSSESTGNPEPVPDTPRDTDARPLPVDHTIRENIYESGKKTRFGNNIAALKVLKQLKAEDRLASTEEQAALAKYQGWGGLPEYFDNKKDESKELKKYLGDLFTEEEFNDMARSTTTSFYTNYEVADKMYSILKNAGFTGGRVLEPSVGTGMFIGAMPEDLKANSKFLTVEKDRISHEITKYLYPNQTHFNMGFETKSLAENSFDVVIGNVPFGNFGVSDSNYRDRTVNKKKIEMKWATARIHNYFLVRSMDLLRPGGIGVLITTTNTMDGKDSSAKTRQYLQQNADVLEVLRLPNEAFKDAGTSVASDIIFFRKKVDPESKELSSTDISNVAQYAGIHQRWDEEAGKINEYFVKNPAHVAGEIESDTDRYGKATLYYRATDFAKKFAKGIKSIASKFHDQFVPAVKTNDESFTIKNAIEEAWAAEEKGLYDGAVHVRDGKFVQYTYGKWVPFHVKGEHQAMAKAAISVRDAAMELQKLERDKNNPSEKLTPYRQKLNKLYDAFVASHGNLNSKGILIPIQNDTRAVAALRALETREGKVWKKIDLFTKRMTFPDVNVDVHGDIKQAISVSLANRGELDIPLISKLLQSSQEDTIKKMEDQNLIFFDPEQNKYVPADEYLAGNILRKLQFVQGRPEYMKQEEALKNILPAQLTSDQVIEGVRFGQQWIPPQVYAQFLREKLKIMEPLVKYDKNTASWTVKTESKHWNATGSHENVNTYGMQDDILHSKWDGIKIVETLMNQKSLKASIREERLAPYQKADVEKERLTNILRRKGEQLLSEFRSFIASNPELNDRITKRYNDKFNSYVLRTHNGEEVYGTAEEPTVIPGLNPKYKLYKHQKDAVIRTLRQQNTLYAHVVGAGKTLEMQTAIMEGRRLGIIRKPLLVVPSFMLEQHSREFKDAYPNAKIKVLATGTGEGEIAGFKSSTEKNRMQRYKELADLMYGDHDVVIMTYEGFERIPVSPAFEEEFLRGEIDKLRTALQSFDSKDFTTKEIQNDIERLETRILDAKGTDIKDIAISFEELGVDALFVDEAHNFKNLMYFSKMGNIAGLSNSNARRSLDMYMKTTYLNKTGAKTIFATGTPIANSVAEMYTMLRYLAPQKLAEHEMEHFDGWAAQFGNTINSVELNTSGKFIEKTRFSEFVNVPELMNMFKDFADVKMANDLPYLKRPQVERETVTTPMSENQKTYLELMVKRAEGMPDDPAKDNMLKLTGEGKKLALDYRIIDGSAQNELESKLNVMAEHIADEYFKTTKGNKAAAGTMDENGKEIQTFDNGTQLVFMDLGVPKADDKKSEDGISEDTEDTGSNSMYQNLKDRLLQLGVKPNEIAFIHDYNKPAQKKALSEKFNKGEIRIIIGSTGKMGVGMNLQKRLTTLHHADPTWRPADIEQREGRIIRQGNWNPNVKVKTYVTGGSFDALMWNTLETKAKFIAQVMSGDTKVRSMDEIAELILSYSEIKASATNNEAMKKLLVTEKELRALRDLEQEHAKEQAQYANRMAQLPQAIENDKKTLETLKEAEKIATDIDVESFEAQMDGVTYSQPKMNEEAAKKNEKNSESARKLFREALVKKLKLIEDQEMEVGASVKIATVGGLDLHVDVEGNRSKISKNLYLQYKGSNGKTIFVANANLTDAQQNEGNGFLMKLSNGLKRLTTKSYSATTESSMKQRETALQEAQQKGNKPFPDRAKLEKMLNEVADLRDQARQFELTNSYDTVFQNGKDLYIVRNMGYQEVPSKNKKKQKENKSDYVPVVHVQKIDSIEQNVEYLDEHDQLHYVNVFNMSGNSEEMRDIAFIQNFNRREDVVGITSRTFDNRLVEIKRIKDQMKAEQEQAVQLQEQGLGMDGQPVTQAQTQEQPKQPTQTASTQQTESTSGPNEAPHQRRIKGWNQATVAKEKGKWTVKTSVSGADWAKFNSFMQSHGGTYHKKADPVEAFRSKFTFDKYPEDIFVSQNSNGPKGFSVGTDTMEHNISPKTAKAVMDKLARALKTVIRPGNVEVKKAAASFNPHKYAGNIKNKWIHNIRIAAHELGHAFETRGFEGNVDELLQVGETYYPAWDQIKKQADRISEGRAELFTLYLLDPALAGAMAPESIREIQDIISNDSVLQKVMDDIHQTVGLENQKGVFERGIGSIKMPSEKRISRNIGDEYNMDNVPEGANKREEIRAKSNGFLKKSVASLIDFKIPWTDVQKELDSRDYSGKNIVKMLGVTGNSDLHARNSFTGWARDHRGRYIVNYKTNEDVPEYLQGLQGKLTEMDPAKITSSEKKYELYERYASAYKEFIGDGMNRAAAKEKAILQALSSRPLQEIAEDGMVHIAEKVKNGEVPNEVIEQFKRIKADKSKKESPEFQVFANIIQAYRAKERYSRLDAEGNQKFKEVYMDENLANDIVAQSQQVFPDLENLIKEYTTNLSDIIMTKLVKSGVEGEETRANVEAASNYYIPTYYAESGSGITQEESDRKTARKVIHNFRGRQAIAVNFLDASLYKLMEVEQSIEFKQVLNEVETIIRQENMGAFGEILKPQMIPQLIGGEQLAKQVAGTVESVLGDTIIDIDQLEESISNQVFTRFFPVDMMKQPILMNWNGDKKTFIRLAPDLYNSLRSMKPIHVGPFLRIAARLSSWTRHFQIISSRFIMNQVSRDFFSAAIQQNAHDGATSTLKFMKSYLKGAALSAGADPKLVDQYITSGAFMSAHENMMESFKRANVSDGLIQTKVKGWKKTKAGRFVHIFSPSTILQWQEQISRYGVWEAKARQLAAEYGLDPKKIFDGRQALTVEEQAKMEKILLDLGYEASEVTTNFRTHGTSEGFRKFEQPISFLHGSIQGIYRELREVANPKTRKRAFLRMSTTLLPMTLISWALLQALEPDDKDDITSEMRDKYWIIPTGNHYIFITKPFGYTIPLDHMERMLDHVFGKPGARKWYEDFFNPEIQNFTLPFLPIYGQLALDLYSNKTWYGASIRPTYEKSKFDEINSKTSSLAEWQAEAELATLGPIAQIFGKDPESVVISPNQFDYAMRSLFGTPGKMATSAIDSLAGKQRSVLDTTQINYVDKSTMSSRFANKFYDKSNAAEAEYKRQINNGQAVKGEPTPKVKAYRQMTKDLADMRKIKEDVANRDDLTSQQKQDITRQVNNAMHDVSRYGNGVPVTDPNNINQVMSWVEQYRSINK